MKKTVLSFALVFAAFFSCQQDDLKELKKGSVPDDIIGKLQAAGFDTSEGLMKYRNGYLVEYDILLTESEINELAESKSAASHGRVKHYRTTNLVTAPGRIKIHMDPGFDTHMQNAFDAALARYNSESLALSFERWYTSSTADIRIIAFYENSNVLGFSSGFPSGSKPASSISLNTFHYNGTQRADATTVIAHEIGHAIGFRHTDYMNRSFSCGAGGNEGSAGVGAVHIPGTPTAPSANSWMLACSNGTDRPFTTEDKAALCTTYAFGKEELYVIANNNWNGVDHSNGWRYTVICSDWSNPEAMASTSGYVFTVKDGELYRTDVNTYDGATISLGSGWGGTEAMTGGGGYVYAVQGGELWKTNGTTGATVSLGGGWSGTEAITVMGGYVYAVQGGEFWKTDVNTGSSVSLGSGWEGTTAMTSYNGYIYTAHGGHLYRTDTNGNTISLGSWWTNTTAMTTYGGYIFIAQGGQLWKLNPNDINTIPSLGAWNGVQVMTGLQ